jgi:hypothetical protein
LNKATPSSSDTQAYAAILIAVPRSWIISMAILVVCLLASMVIASIKLF